VITGKLTGPLQQELFAVPGTSGAEPVLMALKPEFYELIWQGRKTHEFRRKFLCDRPVRWFVYLTAPVSRLTAVISLDDLFLFDHVRRVIVRACSEGAQRSSLWKTTSPLAAFMRPSTENPQVRARRAVPTDFPRTKRHYPAHSDMSFRRAVMKGSGVLAVFSLPWAPGWCRPGVIPFPNR
jgi:predicted transcriptional regulator